MYMLLRLDEFNLVYVRTVSSVSSDELVGIKFTLKKKY